MSPSRPLSTPSLPTPSLAASRPHRLRVLAALCCLLLLGCAPSQDAGEPAAEEALTDRPVQEEGQVTEGPEALGAEQVAVELPGLPVGGSGQQFSGEAPSACVEVNWTAGTLLEGVRVEIREVQVPAPFTGWAGPCSRPCEGSVLTAASSWCEVGVALADPATALAAPVTAELGVGRTLLSCDSPTLCEQTLELVRAEGPATIDLEVVPSGDPQPGQEGELEVEPDLEEGADKGVEPGGTASSPADGEDAASPAEGSG